MRIEDGQNKHTDDDDSNGEDEIQFQFKLRAEAKSIKHFLFALEQKLYLTSFVTKSRTKRMMYRGKLTSFLIMMKVVN